MKYTKDIIKYIEEFAPPELACSWDNSGWQVNLGHEFSKKVLLCLTCTDDVVNQAIINNVDLIITHHPLIFSKINNVTVGKNSSLIKAIKNNIEVYAAHTNLDSCHNGIASCLAKKVGLVDSRPIKELGNESNLGRRGELFNGDKLDNFIKKLKINFNISNVNVINNCHKNLIEKIAVVPGAGGGLISKLNNTDIDVLITGDIGYHSALEAENFIVIDISHFESERIILPILKDMLEYFKIDVIVAKEKPPWRIY